MLSGVLGLLMGSLIMSILNAAGAETREGRKVEFWVWVMVSAILGATFVMLIS